MSSNRFTKIITIVVVFALSLSAVAIAETLSQKTLRLARQRQAEKAQPQQQARNPYIKSSVSTVAKITPAAVPVRPATTGAAAMSSTAVVETQVVSAAPVVAAASTAAIIDDPLLDLVPADCLFCVRINNLDTTLAKTDQFLMGLSPMQIGMVAKMSVGGIIGDPMLTSINTKGQFALFGMMAPGQQMPEFGFIAPVTSFDNFTAANANASQPDAEGISTLTLTNAPLPQLYASALDEDGYMLLAMSPQSILALKDTIANSSLTASIDAGEQAVAAAQPLWAYVNIAQLNNTFGPMLSMQLEQIKQEIENSMPPEGSPDMPFNPADVMSGYFEILQQLLDQSQYISLSINPTMDAINIKKTFAAKSGSDLAGLLQTVDLPASNFKTAGYLNTQEAVNFIVKVDKPMSGKINAAMLDFLDTILPDTLEEDMIIRWKTMMVDSIKATGDEQAFSFSFAKGQPPFTLKEVIMIDDPDAYATVMDESFQMVGEWYEAMNLPITFETGQSAEEYNGVTIETATVNFNIEEFAGGGQESAKAITAIYGEDGMEMKMAMTDNFFLLTMGPDAVAQIKDLIDQTAASTPPAPTGDIATALATLPDTENANFIGTINYIRLLAGVGDMMLSTPIPDEAKEGMASLFDSFKIDTQSCLSFEGTVDQGKITVDVVMPKKHIIEIMTVAVPAINNMRATAKEIVERNHSQQMDTDMMMGEMEMDFEMDNSSDSALSVKITIIGITDEATEDKITDKLSTMTDDNGHSMSWSKVNDKLIIDLSPVNDVQAFVDKIDFGTVDSVQGRKITVTAK